MLKRLDPCFDSLLPSRISSKNIAHQGVVSDSLITLGKKQLPSTLILSTNWNENIEKIREGIIELKENLKGADPKDRLDLVSKIMDCIQFMKQSNIGWASMLANPQMANELDEEALRDIFGKFRKITIERIENDVDSIDRYMINLIPRNLGSDPLN